MSNCSDLQTARIRQEMRAYTKRLLPDGPLPDWAEAAMKQHAEYAAQDWCKSRGLAGLSAAPTLPSIKASEAFWKGEPGAWWLIAKSVLERAAIAGASLYVVGARDRLIRNSLAVSLGIQAVVLWQVKSQLPPTGDKP